MYETLKASILVYVFFNVVESTIQTQLEPVPHIDWTDQLSH
jgi:hypothetical protein